METTERRLLEIDLESTPNLGWAYGKWDTKLIKIEQYSAIMSFSWRWYGETEIHHLNWATVPRKRGTSANKALIMALWELLDEAKEVMAFNGYKFDVPMARAAFTFHRLPPTSPFKIIDPLRMARSHFKYPGGNSLNEVAKYLGVGAKAETGYGELWSRCLDGDKEAWRLLEVYNNQDIQVMEDVYNVMRPHITNHPNLGDLYGIDGVCPKCLSNKLEKRGFNLRRNGKVQRYQCKNCAGWCSEASIKKTGRTVNA